MALSSIVVGFGTVACITPNAEVNACKTRKVVLPSSGLQKMTPTSQVLRLTSQKSILGYKSCSSVPRRSQVLCMAHPKRVARVQQQVKREISTLFLTDKVIRKAIYPNEAMGADYALSSLATVTDLQLTNDLQVAKVYVSVYADEETKQSTLAALQRLEGYTRKRIGERVRLRLTPDVRYILDDSYIRATKVLSLLEKLDAERQGRSNVVDSAIEDSEDNEDDDEVLVIR